MRRLVVWRHGRTAWNAEHRFQGQTDIPLDPEGHAQARRSAAMLAALPPDVIVCSDLQRAQETAQPLSELTGLAVNLDPALRETAAGEWEGKTRPELLAEYGDGLARWAVDANMHAGVTGETRVEVADRTTAAIERGLARTPAGGVLVVVTHGGSARAAIGRLLGLPPEHWAALGVLTNCSWTVLIENDRSAWRVAAEADTPSRSATWPAPPWRLQEYNAGSLPEPVPVDGVWPADDR